VHGAALVRLGRSESQRHGHGAVGEHALSAAEQHWVHPEIQPVDEAETQQRLHEVEAADDVHLVVPFLHGGDTRGEVAGDEARAVPCERLGQRAARDVLRHPVEQVRERNVLGRVRPVVREDVVGLPPEEQRVHALCLFEQDVARLLVVIRRHPSPVHEAAVAVLVGPARRLGHAVERHELGDDELPHHASSVCVALLRITDFDSAGEPESSLRMRCTVPWCVSAIETPEAGSHVPTR
jgi:hypothetical protein